LVGIKEREGNQERVDTKNFDFEICIDWADYEGKE
jgi:hypothetical protein